MTDKKQEIPESEPEAESWSMEAQLAGAETEVAALKRQIELMFQTAGNLCGILEEILLKRVIV